jgi:hypothetical protein
MQHFHRHCFHRSQLNLWDQCGGINSPTTGADAIDNAACCPVDSRCARINAWYYQCLPGGGAPPAAPPASLAWPPLPGHGTAAPAAPPGKAPTAPRPSPPQSPAGAAPHPPPAITTIAYVRNTYRLPPGCTCADVDTAAFTRRTQLLLQNVSCHETCYFILPKVHDAAVVF